MKSKVWKIKFSQLFVKKTSHLAEKSTNFLWKKGLFFYFLWKAFCEFTKSRNFLWGFEKFCFLWGFFVSYLLWKTLLFVKIHKKLVKKAFCETFFTKNYIVKLFVKISTFCENIIIIIFHKILENSHKKSFNYKITIKTITHITTHIYLFLVI